MAIRCCSGARRNLLRGLPGKGESSNSGTGYRIADRNQLVIDSISTTPFGRDVRLWYTDLIASGGVVNLFGSLVNLL